MREFGGFEHNLQSLRVVDELEERYAEFPGPQPDVRDPRGHPQALLRRQRAQAGRAGAQRFLERRQPGLEAQLANLADEIAYNNHDVDDGLRAGLIDIEELRELADLPPAAPAGDRTLPGLSTRRLVHEVVRRMIDYVVSDLIDATTLALVDAAPASVDDVRAHARAAAAFQRPGARASISSSSATCASTSTGTTASCA